MRSMRRLVLKYNLVLLTPAGDGQAIPAAWYRKVQLCIYDRT